MESARPFRHFATYALIRSGTSFRFIVAGDLNSRRQELRKSFSKFSVVFVLTRIPGSMEGAFCILGCYSAPRRIGNTRRRSLFTWEHCSQWMQLLFSLYGTRRRGNQKRKSVSIVYIATALLFLFLSRAFSDAVTVRCSSYFTNYPIRWIQSMSILIGCWKFRVIGMNSDPSDTDSSGTRQ